MKNTIKTLTSLLLIACLALSMAACGSSGNGETTEAPTTEATTEPTEATTEPTAAPTTEATDATEETTESTEAAEVTEAPTEAPAVTPTEAPVVIPTEAPAAAPTEAPAVAPTEAPVVAPTEAPTVAPTEAPTVAPTEVPTEAPAPVHTHSYTASSTVAPTCTTDGYTVYTCSCGDSYQGDIVPATGEHLWHEPTDEWLTISQREGWTPVIGSTMTCDVEQSRTCYYCGYTENRTYHWLGEWYPVKQPTTEEDGENRRDCAFCDYSETEVVPKLEGSWIPDLDAASAAGNAYITSIGWYLGDTSLGGYFPSFSASYNDLVENYDQATLNQQAINEVAATYEMLKARDGEEAMQYVTAYCAVLRSGDEVIITVYYG